MAYTHGIDVSRYQGEIDWKKVASAGYCFAVIRATIGDYYTDPFFYTNWAGAKEAGLLVSAYHVVVATRYAENQIDRFFSILGSRKADLPLVLDIERDDNVSNAANTACIQDCISEIGKKDPRRPIIYTARYYWKDHVLPSADWEKYDLWVASYTETPLLPPGWSRWRFWQYSPNGRVPGIAGSTDSNWFNGSIEDLRRYASGSTPPPVDIVTGIRAQVTATVLNVRSGPGIGFKKNGSLKTGDKVTIQQISGRDVWLQPEPGKWVACYYGGNQYIAISPAEKSGTGLQARVLVDYLNIRSGPGVVYSKLGQYHTGNTFNIQGIRGKDAWVQIDPGKWCAFSYGADQYLEISA